MSLVIGCDCATGMGNTGLPNCQELFGLSLGLGLTPMVASDLTPNRIDISAPLGATTFTDLLTQTDKTKRIYPIIDLKNVDFPKEETQYETDNTNQKARIRDGIQSYTGEKWEVSNVFVSKLQQARCSRNGNYLFTRNGVVGVKKNVGGTDYLYPIEVNAFDSQYMFDKGDAVSKAMITFDFSTKVNIGELWMLRWEDVNTDIDSMIGLLDANFTQVSAPAADTPIVGQTTAEYKLRTDYGTGTTDAQNIPGQIATDFELYNNTAAALASIVTVTEVADTKYTFVWTSETPADSLTLRFKTASGFEGEIDLVQP